MADEIRTNRVCTLTVVISLVVFLLYSAVVTAFSQSTSLDYPTAVTTGQIVGKIRARDMGDSRLTSHYYIFETGTGDVVLNIEATNLNGDIDIYTAGSLKPLLKASVYASSYATVMQREVYLRLPSRLILRIEGRTPNDDPADYKIAFGGAFKAIAASSVPKNPGDPRVTGANTDRAVARVSSTGAVIEEIKPPPPVVKPPVKSVTKPPVKNTAKTTVPKDTAKDTAKNTAKKPDKPVVATPLPDPDKKKDVKTPKPAKPVETATKKPEKPKTEDRPKNTSPSAKKSKEPEDPKDDPLADLELVIKLKNGSKLRYPMTDVFQVTVENGSVKIILKNGKLINRPLLEIEEMKIGQ